MSKQTDERSSILLLLLPIWLMFTVIMIPDDDQNSLLTDEQKLEKQKQIAEREEQKRIEHEQNVKWWKDNINFFLENRPFPYAHAAGMLVFIVGYTAFTRARYDYYSRFTNPYFICAIGLGFLYLTWLSGYVNYEV